MTPPIHAPRKNRPMKATVVPNVQTRYVARAMLETAVRTTGADAVIRWLPEVPPHQAPALLALILESRGAMDRPQLPLEFTEDERRRLHAAYAKGKRDARTTAGEREYQRLAKRAQAVRKRAS